LSIFLSSGEASGDHYTANIARALRRAGYAGDLWGMGSGESRAAGVRCDWDGEQLQIMGLTEIFSSVPIIFKLMRSVVDQIMEKKPRAVIVADSPDYHLRLLWKLRRRGYRGRVFYISPPTVWAWRSWRTKELKRNVDECLPLFGFEHEFLLTRGCNSYWVGHPFVDEFADEKKYAFSGPLADKENIVAFMPGSRRSEVSALLPIMERAALALEQRGWLPVFSVAPGLNRNAKEKMLERLQIKNFAYYDGAGRELLRSSACSVAASGTITVEALLLHRYQVVAYKLNPISALVARLAVRTKYYSMTNILADSPVFPELLQERATAQNIVASVLEWLEGGAGFRTAVCEKMCEARQKLGRPGAYDFWASRVMKEASC